MRVFSIGVAKDPVSENPIHVDPSENIIGAANEARVLLENIWCNALLDTGSQVSTLAESFYRKHFIHLSLEDCSSLLRIEGAGGHTIPYLGYFVAMVQLNGTAAVDVPVLVVQDTEYHSSVPFLLGTNVLRHLEVTTDARLHRSVALAIQAVKLADKHLDRSQGIFGTVYLADDCLLQPGEVRTMCGYLLPGACRTSHQKEWN